MGLLWRLGGWATVLGITPFAVFCSVALFDGRAFRAKLTIDWSIIPLTTRLPLCLQETDVGLWIVLVASILAARAFFLAATGKACGRWFAAYYVIIIPFAVLRFGGAVYLSELGWIQTSIDGSAVLFTWEEKRNAASFALVCLSPAIYRWTVVSLATVYAVVCSKRGKPEDSSNTPNEIV